jgi:protein gp37
MADTTKIEWTDATWNIITGCSVISPGCTNCYAMRLAGTRIRHHPSRQGLTDTSKAGPVWNGEVRFNEQWLTQPFGWKEPRRIFVCAHGDLFHDAVPDEWIDRVFAVMALCPQHTFQVLTKRAKRMREYLSGLADESNDDPRQPHQRILAAAEELLVSSTRYQAFPGKPGHHLRDLCEMDDPCLPLPNVWLGVSVEDQARADERIPELLATPAAVRFLSCEPLLGPISLRWLPIDYKPRQARGESINEYDAARMLGWVIVGGESGPNTRPMHPDWARSLRDQCQAAGVPFFFKQWGEWAPLDHSDAADEAGWQGRAEWMIMYPDGDIDIPDHRWPDEDAGEAAVLRVGKKAAGRLLDGREWSEMPG